MKCNLHERSEGKVFFFYFWKTHELVLALSEKPVSFTIGNLDRLDQVDQFGVQRTEHGRTEARACTTFTLNPWMRLERRGEESCFLG